MLMHQEYNHGSREVNNRGSLTGDNFGYTVPGMKYGERLKRARQYADLTQKELETRIGAACSQENISKLERGDATGSEFTAQFAEACGVRAIWLATGQGDMVDGYQIRDEHIKRLAMVAEKLPTYAVDQLSDQGDAMAQLIKKAQGTQ